MSQERTRISITVRPLDERELPEADRIFRLAFGTFLDLPDPLSFMGDADMIRSRWLTDPEAALGAFLDNTLVGSNFVTNWGSFGFFGPLTVRPDFWNKGVAQRLLAATMELFARWKTRQAALFTFPQSGKHIGLYQRYGFWPQYLTAVMMKPSGPGNVDGVSMYSEVPLQSREVCLASCRGLTHAVFPGLDLQREIQSVAAQKIGETVLIHDGTELVGFAICHLGKGSEAGSGAAYLKFGGVRPGPNAAESFARLLSACEALAHNRGLARVVAGVNTARHDAYQIMLHHGFRTMMQGVAMQSPNEPGYNRPDRFVIDDWR